MPSVSNKCSTLFTDACYRCSSGQIARGPMPRFLPQKLIPSLSKHAGFFRRKQIPSLSKHAATKLCSLMQIQIPLADINSSHAEIPRQCMQIIVMQRRRHELPHAKVNSSPILAHEWHADVGEVSPYSWYRPSFSEQLVPPITNSPF